MFAGGRYVSATLAQTLAARLFSDTQKPPQELLSDREYDVLCLIGSGKLVSQIAHELTLSVKTISTYRARILEKMGMKNNAQLMPLRHGAPVGRMRVMADLNRRKQRERRFLTCSRSCVL